MCRLFVDIVCKYCVPHLFHEVRQLLPLETVSGNAGSSSSVLAVLLGPGLCSNMVTARVRWSYGDLVGERAALETSSAVRWSG